MVPDRIYLGHTTQITTGSLVRPSNVTRYAIGDVIGTSQTHILTFSNIARSKGGSGMISSAVLIDYANQAVLPQVELWLFSIAPAAQVDNAPCAVTDAELSSLVGVIPLDTAGRPGNVGAGGDGNAIIQSDIASLSYKCGAQTRDLFGFLIAKNTYIPVAGEAMLVQLSALQDY